MGRWNWTSNFNPQQFPMTVEAGATAVIAVTTHGPFGEVERATGRWLPAMRLLAATGLCGLAILALHLGVVGEVLNDGILVLARGCHLLRKTRNGVLAGHRRPARMGTTAEYMAFCQYAD
jgi:hypothetical protein